MDSPIVIAFPRPTDAEADTAAAPALVEIGLAIALVSGRAARRVRLVSLKDVDAIAAIGLAHAQAAGVAFIIERSTAVGGVTVTVGPRA